MNLSRTEHRTFMTSEFLSAICHEIKNPLSAIIGLSEIISLEINNPKSVPECESYAKEIVKTALEINDLVHDLLDIGQVFSGNFSIDVSNKIDVRELVHRAVKLNQDFAIRRGIILTQKVAQDIAPIRLDMKRMKQVLHNLISNAIKYSPEKTEVIVFAQNIVLGEKQYLQISVKDHGFGMSEEEVVRSFQKYQTIPNPNSGKVDSFGLGLPITKDLVERQGGKIEVISRVGGGSEFIMQFPL